MKKMTKVFAILGAAALLFTGCQSAASSSEATSSSTASSSSQPASSSTAALSGNVSVNGSTSMEKVIGGLAEQFMADNSGVKVTYDPTGSGTGIEAARTGSTDIGLSSRTLKEEETASGLTGTTIALDGIAVVVNADNPVADLTVEQIAQIFKGEVTDWSAVGGNAGTIACIGREAGSGTRDGFESITGTEDACVLSQELTSTGAVIESVKQNPNAIGYACLLYTSRCV